MSASPNFIADFCEASEFPTVSWSREEEASQNGYSFMDHYPDPEATFRCEDEEWNPRPVLQELGQNFEAQAVSIAELIPAPQKSKLEAHFSWAQFSQKIGISPEEGLVMTEKLAAVSKRDPADDPRTSRMKTLKVQHHLKNVKLEEVHRLQQGTNPEYSINAQFPQLSSTTPPISTQHPVPNVVLGETPAPSKFEENKEAHSQWCSEHQNVLEKLNEILDTSKWLVDPTVSILPQTVPKATNSKVVYVRSGAGTTPSSHSAALYQYPATQNPEFPPGPANLGASQHDQIRHLEQVTWELQQKVHYLEEEARRNTQPIQCQCSKISNSTPNPHRLIKQELVEDPNVPSSSTPVVSRDPIDDEFEEIIPFNPVSDIPNVKPLVVPSPPELSQVPSFEEACEIYERWEDRDKVIEGVDLTTFLFNPQGSRKMPQKVRNVVGSFTVFQDFFTRETGITGRAVNGYWRGLAPDEKQEWGKRSAQLRKWQNWQIKNCLVRGCNKDQLKKLGN
eukprot:NP_494604.1 Uncharacterized protein CELE_F19B10.11 [Caenorhabditis elegans]